METYLFIFRCFFYSWLVDFYFFYLTASVSPADSLSTHIHREWNTSETTYFHISIYFRFRANFLDEDARAHHKVRRVLKRRVYTVIWKHGGICTSIVAEQTLQNAHETFLYRLALCENGDWNELELKENMRYMRRLVLFVYFSRGVCMNMSRLWRARMFADFISATNVRSNNTDFVRLSLLSPFTVKTVARSLCFGDQQHFSSETNDNFIVASKKCKSRRCRTYRICRNPKSLSLWHMMRVVCIWYNAASFCVTRLLFLLLFGINL